MSATTGATGTTAVDRRAFWIRKLHSLSGLVPVGAFMCFHLFENYSAVHGAKEFGETVEKIGRMPFVAPVEILGLQIPVVEALGIWIPILFHAVFGIAIILEGRPNAVNWPYGRNWLYVLQRVTGILAFLFIVYHFWNFRWRKEEFLAAPFDDVASTLADPVNLWVYVVGIAACVFHLANGLSGFLFSWGITAGERAKRMAGWACAGIGAAVFALGMRALFAFVR
jgi:succinate dehydrogenase/fumarate reductase cytochrome b subunit (b558 family)